MTREQWRRLKEAHNRMDEAFQTIRDTTDGLPQEDEQTKGYLREVRTSLVQAKNMLLDVLEVHG